MKKAIEVLENKRSEWIAKNEYYRREMMKAHVNEEKYKKIEAEQMMNLAIDTIHGLDYAIAVLKGV